MIPTLLWQCPLCHTDDALKHTTHWFKPDQVRCTQCSTVWEVQRVIGNDFLLKVVAGESTALGQQRALAEWYDVMKTGGRLVARDSSGLQLEAGEELYVQSHQAYLLVEEESPLFGGWERPEAPWQKEGDLGLTFMKRWDVGSVALTNERLIWSGGRGRLTFRLTRVNSVHTEVTWYLGLLYGLRLYKFRFRDESVLKWLTYIGLTAKHIEQVHGHRISLSNY